MKNKKIKIAVFETVLGNKSGRGGRSPSGKIMCMIDIGLRSIV
jgi:hypothetical protein